MFRPIFSTFLTSLRESYKLQEKYRLRTTRLGWVAVALGCLAMIVIMYYTRLMVGLPLEGSRETGVQVEWWRLRLLTWVVLIIVSVPFAFYLGMVVVYGGYGLLMFLFGKWTWKQAVDFGLGAKCPEYWYKQDA